MAKNQTANTDKAAAEVEKKPGTELAEKANTQLAVGAINFEEDAGAGTEGVDKDSQAIPFLAILQSNSPAVAEELVKGAKPGQFMNTVTNELFDSILIVPCAFERRFVQWAPRAMGGGYKGAHMPIDVEAGKVGYQAEGGGYFVKNETSPGELTREQAKDKQDMLKDTRSHYVLAVREDGTFFPALFPLASTQIKKSKKLNSMVLGKQLARADGSLYNPASWAFMYKLTTAVEKNDQGSWRGVLVEEAGQVKKADLYAAGKEFNQLVKAGQVKVQDPTQDVAGDEDAAGGGEAF